MCERFVIMSTEQINRDGRTAFCAARREHGKRKHMNEEERRQRRQKDTKNATVVFIVFLLIVTILVGVAAFLVGKFVLNDKKPKQKEDTQAQTEQQEGTEQIEVPAVPAVDPLDAQAAELAAGMTLEDKIAQMFIITPEALTGFSSVTAAGDTTKESYNNRPVGGIVYLSGNLLDKEQTQTMLANMKAIAVERTGLVPFLCVDEEGGSVARVAGNSAFGVTDVGDMSAIGETGDAQNAYNAGSVIGTYLKELGFNVDFAPVADVLTNPANTVIGNRAFSGESQVVAEMVSGYLQGMSTVGIYGTAKHFPGHGGTSGDSHNGPVSTERTLEELMAEELVPFQSAIDVGVSFVMVGHISVPNVTGDDIPATISKTLVTDVLRTQMGYNGIIITDGMNMGAITNAYNSDAAAVAAIAAGADIVLMPADYQTAYDGVLAAVGDGRITEERINESVVRIIKVKLQMNQ